MFRKNTNEDITPEEYELYIEPHKKIVEEYLRKYLIPDYCAFYVASGYRLNTFEEQSFNLFVESALDFFNIDYNKKTKIIVKKGNIECTTN